LDIDIMFKLRSNPRRGQQPYNPAQHPHSVVTTGFDDDPAHTVYLHYTERLQPDLAGALAFSYDLYALPLQDVVGPFVAARHSFRMATPPMQFFQQAPVTGMGGTFTGNFIYQPLLDPTNPNGFDINDI
jgi:hypothetical protein